MEKSVSDNLEHPSAVACHPRGLLNHASVMILDRGRILDGERAEDVFASQGSDFAHQALPIDRPGEGPLIPSPEW